MSTPAPSTPDHAPRKAAALSRSFTLPSRFAPPKKSDAGPEIGATEGLETLYTHPSVKILKFSTSSRPDASNSGGQQGNGTLPWASSSEQTMAAGPMEIYSVPGSVSFLRSGSLLHAIMPRSQCWCVDGVSKFAMKVPQPDTYYRIELPGDTSEDLEKVEELKLTFKKVLHFERTACPFARTFTIELPEEPQIQVKKRRKREHGPAKRWRLDKAYSWKPEDGEEPPIQAGGDEDEGSGSVTGSDESSLREDSSAEDSELADEVGELSISTPPRPTVRDRVRDFSTKRSFTAPVLATQSTPPSRLRTSVIAESMFKGADSPSPSVVSPQISTESRTFQSIPTDMPPSPPDSSAGFDSIEPTILANLAKPPTLARYSGRPLTQDLNMTDAGQGKDIHPEEIPVNPIGTGTGPHETTETELFVAPVTPQRHLSTGITPYEEEATLDSKPNPSKSSLPSQGDVPGGAEATEEFRPTTLPSSAEPDPFAQIQARIQARRSIGGANDPRFRSLYPAFSPPAATITSRRPPLPRQSSQRQQALATAIVNKACAVFLGPPAHLVKIMLRIAARFANGTFGGLLFKTPQEESTRVPGSFNLDGSDIEDFGLDVDDDEQEEDDFGVPLRSPIRLAARAEATSRSIDVADDSSTRERRGWEVD